MSKPKKNDPPRKTRGQRAQAGNPEETSTWKTSSRAAHAAEYAISKRAETKKQRDQRKAEGG